MNKFLAVERETIILFNEGEMTAEIETSNVAIKRRLEVIQREHSEEITLVRHSEYADTYIFPKKWIKIIPPRKATKKQWEHLKNARANIKF